MGNMPEWFAKTPEMCASDLYFSEADAGNKLALGDRYVQALQALVSAPRGFFMGSKALDAAVVRGGPLDQAKVDHALNVHFHRDWINQHYNPADPATFNLGGRYWPTIPSETVLNVLQCFGWAIFELIVIAKAAGLLCDKLFGFEATWFWTLLFGALTMALALLGPIGFVRRYVRKLAIWAVAASLAYLTWWILDGAGGHDVWSSKGHHGSFWAAVDIVIAVTVSWAPLVADYTRFSRDRRSAFFGVGVGYFLPTLFQFGFGSLLVLSRGLDPDHPELFLVAIAGGGAAAALALLALTVDETDEAFANTYSAAVSLQNLFPEIPQRFLILVASAVATGGALWIDLRSYQAFLFLLGSFFVPLLGVLIADWLLSGMRYDADRFFAAPAVRPAQIGAWLAGFALYQWLYPNGPSWWLDFIHHDTPPYDISASIPSFALAFALAALAGVLGRRPRTAFAQS